MRRIITRTLLLTIVTMALVGVSNVPAFAATIPSNDFSLEVSPSPLAATVEPGVATTLELKIRNASTKPEQLKIETRSFRIAYPNQDIVISGTTPPDLAQWVSYKEPTFTVQSGQWFTQRVTVSLPEQAGFSSPFMIIVSRANDSATTVGGRLIKGSVGVFALINVNKPGATRTLEVSDFKPERSVYEYLPTRFTLKLRNTGNSIVQPYGNIYVQRSGNDSDPISVLPVNDARSYILPGNTKEITASWESGFPIYTNGGSDKDGKPQQILRWNWQDSNKFRFGRYTAKVVAVYNDGTRDVPITGEVTFWVIPWRILLGLLVVVLLVGLGAWSFIRRIIRGFTRLKRHTPPRD